MEIERAKELFLLEKAFAGNHQIFNGDHGLVYGIGHRGSFPRYDGKGVTEAEHLKKAVQYWEKHIETIPENSAYGAVCYSDYLNAKARLLAIEKSCKESAYTFAKGHINRGIDARGQGWETKNHPIDRWFFVCGKTVALTVKGAESSATFKTENALHEAVCKSFGAISVLLSSDKAVVTVNPDRKGKFIGKGGDNINFLASLIGKKVVLK